MHPFRKHPPWDEALSAWRNWFASQFPDEPPVEFQPPQGGWENAELQARLSDETLAHASVANGRELFSLTSCAKCHRHGDLGESMGPDLSTIGMRFSTKDIVDAIINPSRIVSDQYRTQTIVTNTGDTHTGIVGSGGPEELLVLTTDGTKVRIRRDEVEHRAASTTSAMPDGLLNTLTLEQVADLMAFLKSPSTEKVSQNPE